MECPICITKISPSRKVTCQFCDYTACSKCVQTYLTSTADDANCMNCKRAWNREALLTYLPKTFVNNEYRKHRENMLFERETAMMPSTQVFVDQEIQRRANVALLNKMCKERAKLRRKLYELTRACQEIQANLTPPLEQQKRSFVQRCGNPECHGFLSTSWKCNICLHYTCSECCVVKGLERDAVHTCNEDDKRTMQTIRNDSKRCPGCAQYIFKIDGCDQMWCTNCHTAFSWRTGQTVNGLIHNPHFYEFQRSRTTLDRQVGDIPCGGLPTLHELKRSIYAVDPRLFNILVDIHRVVIHVELDELPRYNVVVDENNNLDLRIKYMLNELSSQDFKLTIQKREKALQKKRDIALVFNMFVTVMSDYFRQMMHRGNIHTYMEDLLQLINYTNASLITVAKRFDCVVPVICAHDNIFRVITVAANADVREVKCTLP